VLTLNDLFLLSGTLMRYVSSDLSQGHDKTMKLPKNKQTELEKKGKPDSAKVSGGGAQGRLRQFEEARGIADTDLSNPAADEAGGDVKKKPKRARKK
jgi:hypothetical protein